MKKQKSGKSKSKTEPHPPRFNKLIRNISDTVSESYVKSLLGFKDYIYEINYTKNSKLQKINAKFRKHLKLYLITFPPSLKTIDSKSISGMKYLFQISFLKNDDNENFLETIEDRALKDTNIDFITIPINIINIGSNCFPKCLKAIEFENGAPKLQSIGNTSFSKTQLETFKMPINISPFLNSRNIFLQCHKLTELIFDSYISKDDPPKIDNEERESQIQEKTKFIEKVQELINSEKFDETLNTENEPTLDLADNYMISQIPTLKTLEVFVSNLNHFYFFNTPNLTSINIPKSDNGRYIKHNGCLYTKDKKKLIVAERSIKTATIFSDCEVISNYALNVKSLEKVSFEENSKLQEISLFAFADSNIQNLNIPDSVNLINHGAFYNCSKLESVNIPTSLYTLDYATFSYSNLKQIKIPKNVTRIRLGCFYKCSQLSKIEFEKDSVLIEIDDYAFYGTSIDSISIPKNARKIGNYCFMNCNKLSKIEFENDSNLSEIGNDCFKGTQIEEFQLPQKIEKYDFSKTNVKTVNFSNCSSLNLIGNFMLSAITQVSIPPNVIEIQSHAFRDCINLTKIEIIDLPNSKLETIGNEAFSNCSSLAEFGIPKTVKFIGFRSFKNCIKLTTQISIESNKITVFKEAFSNSGITAFQSKASKIFIGESAFKNCEGLKSFAAEADKSIKLESSSFEDCNTLADIKLNPNTEKVRIDDNCFMNSSIKSIEIPNNLTVVPKFCFKNCSKLKQVIIKEESQLSLFEKEAFKNSGIKSILIPPKTELIEESCFEHCSQLTKLTFSKKLQECTIKEKAFYNSGIHQLNITKAIKNIEISAFEQCTKLKKVTFSNDLSFDTIQESTFQSSGIENLIIPSKILSIGKSSFQNCSQLKSVTFQGENTKIDQFAFSGCENLQVVKCKDQIKVIPARSTEIFDQNPVTVKLNQKQIDETVIKVFFVSSTPLFQDFYRTSYDYSLVFDMQYRFTTSFDCYLNEHSKYKIIEYKNGGYYSNLMEKLMFCDYSIDEIKVSKDTKVIKSCAFKYSKLKKIEFEENSILRKIKNCAFEYLQINEITIPDSVTDIGNSAFSNCYSLNKVIINTSSNLVTIGEHAFEKTAINTILFPPTLKTVSNYAFYECYNLKQVENYSNELTFGSFSFYNSSVDDINFPEKCIFMNSSFKKCMKLKQLLFTNENEKVVFGVESFAFSGLTEIVIKCEAIIKSNAFCCCRLLKKITLDGMNIKLSKNSIQSPNIEFCSLNLKLKNKKIHSSYVNDILLSKIDKCKLNLTFSDKKSTRQKFKYKNKCYVLNNKLEYADLIDNISLTREYRSESNRRQIKKNEILHIPSCVKNFDFPIMSHLKMIVFSKKCSVEDLGPPGFFSYYNLVEITIPKLVQSIAPRLFEHCHFLKTVKFEKDSVLKEIGEYSFANTRVTKVELPPTVQVIHKAAFSNNLYLEEVIFEGETIEESSFSNTGLKTFKLSNNTKNIGPKAFEYCHSLKKFDINIDQSNLIEIGVHAFSETGITSINIPPNIKTIKSFTFSGCQSLATINVSPKSKLEKIERKSFTANTSLTKITLPKNILSLFSSIFVRAPTLHSILFNTNQRFCVIESKNPKSKQCSIMLNFAKGNTKNSLINNCYVVGNELVYANMIDNANLFEKPSPEEINEPAKINEVLVVPITVKKLNFPSMTHIKRILWSAANIVEDLGLAGSFSYYNLVQFTIPKSVQSIPPHMFENCHHLTTLLFEKDSVLKEIGEYSFANTRVTKVELPPTVQVIHKAAFSNNLYLEEVIFEGETIEESSFSNTGLKTFKLSNNTKNIGPKAFEYCHSLKKFDINIDQSNLIEVGGHAFSETGITLINIPPNIKTIKSFTFSGCRSLNKVSISEKSKLERIDKYAFAENLSLTLINIPTTIKKLSHDAFINTPSLKSIMINSNESFNVLEDHSVYASDRTLVFVPRYLKQFKVIENCLIIHSGAFCGPNLEEVTFSDNSLMCIEKHSFAHSSGLKSITIPNSIQIIGEEAFIHCDNLETVEFDAESKITEIPKFCFAFSGLKSIKLPTLIEVIDQSSFFFCRNLKEVNLDIIKIKYIGDYAFSVTSLEEIKFPSSIKFIGSHSFDSNKSLKLVDLSKLNTIEESNQLHVKDFLKQFHKSRKKLMKMIFDTIKQHSLTPNEIDEHNEVIRNEVPPIDLNEIPKEEDNGKSPRRKPKFSSPKIEIKGSPYLMLKDVPRVFKPNPYINKKVSKIKPPMIYTYNEPLPKDNLQKKKVAFVLPPADQKKNVSPRRLNNKKGKENKQKVNYSSILKQDSLEEEYSQDFTEFNELSIPNENEIIVGTPSPKCYIHKTAFAHSNVSLFKCNFDVIEWFTFFENCAKISKLIINPNIRFRLQKLGKENIDSILNGSLFRITKIQYLNHDTVPVLSHQLITDFLVSKTTKSLNPYNFAYCEKLNKIEFDNGIIIKQIPEFCFAYSSLKEISIPSSVESIGKYSFYSCYNLENVQFVNDSKLGTIEEGAFCDCKKLESIQLPSSVEKIGKCAFMSCTSLQKVTFNENSKLRSIEEYGFNKCKEMKRIDLPQEVEYIGQDSFSYSGLESIRIPNKIKKINQRTFYECLSLKNVELPAFLEEISESSFSRDITMNKIKLPDSVRSIKRNAFSECYKLRKIKISSNTELIEVEDGSFEYTNLSELTVNRKAFVLFEARNVNQLKRINFSGGKPENFIQTKDGCIYSKTTEFDHFIESQTDISALEEKIRESINNDFVNSIYYYHHTKKKRNSLLNKRAKKFKEQRKIDQITKEILIRRNRSKYSENIINDHPILHLIFAPKDLETLVIHEDCFKISESILKDMNNLNNIEYKKGITNSINNISYYRNNIKSIKIQGQYFHLPKYAFQDMNTLETIDIGEESQIEIISECAFSGCCKLREIIVPSTCYSIETGAFKNCVSLSSFVIRKSDSNEQPKLKYIRKDAFYNCSSLEHIVIPSTVYAICESAFMNCLNLNHVEFEESENEQLRIIEKNAFKNCKSLTSFILPSSCTTVGPAAFMNCMGLKTFEYNGTELQSIQSRTFLNCVSLNRIELLNLNVFNETEEEEENDENKNDVKENEEEADENQTEEIENKEQEVSTIGEQKEDKENNEEEDKVTKDEATNKEEEEDKEKIEGNNDENKMKSEEEEENKEETGVKESKENENSNKQTNEEEDVNDSKQANEEEDVNDSKQANEDEDVNDSKQANEDEDVNDSKQANEEEEEKCNIQAKEKEDEKSESCIKHPKSGFFIGAEAFMNCTSLKEVIIEDQSKNNDTILYDKNNSPLFVYPPQLSGKKCIKEFGKRFYIKTRSTIQKRAFYNCKSLTNVRFFLGNLERFHSMAFEKCNLLKTMELNTTFWRFLFTEAFDISSFNGTPENLEIKIFNKGEYLHLNVDISDQLQQQNQFQNKRQRKSSSMSLSLAKSAQKNQILLNSPDNSDTEENVDEFREYLVAENVHIILQRTEEDKVSDFCLYGTQYKESEFEWGIYDSIPFTKSSPLKDFSKMTQLLHSYNFPSNYELTKIIFDDGIQIDSIPDYCFSFTALKEISIPSSVEKIGKCTFMSCTSLQKVTFNENSKLKSIEEYGFSKCKEMKKIDLPQEVEYIGHDSFSYSGLESIRIPNKIKKINQRTFYECLSLKIVELPAFLEEISESSFSRDITMNKIKLPDSVRSIKRNAFSECYKLRKIKISSNTELIEVEDGSFEYTNLSELTVNRKAFVLFEARNVNQLKRINFSGGKPENFIQTKDGCIYSKTTEFDPILMKHSDVIEPCALHQLIENDYLNRNKRNKKSSDEQDYTKLSQENLLRRNRSKYTKENISKHPILHLIFAPKDLKTLAIHEDCFKISETILKDMNNLNNIEYKKGITNSINNISYYRNNIKSIKIQGQYFHLPKYAFQDMNTLETIDIGEESQIEIISECAFSGCCKLREIIIPSTCYSIETGAFKNCVSLKKFQIRTKDKNFNQIMPQLKFIRKEAFLNCESLETITVPSSVYAICESSFMNCKNLDQVKFDDKENSQLEIIEKNAFKNCKSLSSFVLPNNCSIVGPAAFMNCVSMKTFEYDGTKLQSIQCRSFYNCKSLTIFKVKNLPYKNNYSTVSISSPNEIEEEEELKEKVKQKRQASHSFSIGSQAFMNCTSLRKVVIEDKSKNTKTIEFDQNNSPYLLYPSHDYSQLSYGETKCNFSLTPQRQIVARKAFCNCKSLYSVRLFIGNLERIQTAAFKNCNSLMSIETNSQYAAFIFGEGREIGAFTGASEVVDIKLFSKRVNQFAEFEFCTQNETAKKPPQNITEPQSIQKGQSKIKENQNRMNVQKTVSNKMVNSSDQLSSQKKLFKEHFSSLDKTKPFIIGTAPIVFTSGKRLFAEFLSSLDRTKPLFAAESDAKRKGHRRHRKNRDKKGQQKDLMEISYDEMIWSFFKKQPDWINDVVILKPVTRIRCFKSYASRLDRTLPFFSNDIMNISDITVSNAGKKHFKQHMMTTSEIMALKYEESAKEKVESCDEK